MLRPRSRRAALANRCTLPAAVLACTLAWPSAAQPKLEPAPADPIVPALLEPPVRPTAPARGPEDAFGRGTPRSTTRGFLAASASSDLEKAAEYLDLRRIPSSQRQQRGPELAKQLKTVLDRTLWVDPDDLSDDPEGNTDDGLPPRFDRLGSFDGRDGIVDIKLARVPREDGQLIWKVSSDTVRVVPDLHEEFGPPPLAAQLPPVLLDTRFLEVPLWQWIAFGLLLVVAAAGGWLFEVVARRLVLAFAGTARGTLARLFEPTSGPLRLLLALLLFRAGIPVIGLPVPAQQVLAAVLNVLWVVAGTWIALGVAEAIARRIVRRLTERGQLSATALVPMGRRMARFVIYAIGGLFALSAFGVNVTALVAGLGVGGLAVALAAQKTLENLFGGITIIADAPVRVGDFCRFGDRVGTVEEIGLRSTRIRTLDRTVIAVPNGEFSSLQIENFARRDRFLFQTTLGLRYETSADQLRYVVVEIERLLLSDERVHPDPVRVRFIGFGDSALSVEIFAYIRTGEVNEFHEIRQELLLRIMDVVQSAGSGFAFPSRTTYLAKDEGLDPERRRAAEDAVARWRTGESTRA